MLKGIYVLVFSDDTSGFEGDREPLGWSCGCMKGAG